MTIRAAFSVVGWNALILVVVLLGLEAIFGGWFYPNGFGALHVPRGVIVHHDVRKFGQNRSIAVYSRDPWGFRGTHKDPSEIDVLTVGGSTTNELYNDDSETWPSVLQRSFAETGRRVVIGNAGIDGHSSVGHLNSFEVWFPRVPNLKPKFVLFYVGLNDVHVENHERYDTIVPKTPWERFRRYVSNNSALNSGFRTLRGMLRARRARLVYLDDPPKLAPIDANPTVDSTAYAARLAEYAGRLSALAVKTREFGARPIFITQRRGDAFIIEGRTFATNSGALVNRVIQNLFNSTTMRVCHEVGAICIDLANEIDFEPEDFWDPFHTNSLGSRKIGKFLYRKLKNIF